MKKYRFRDFQKITKLLKQIFFIAIYNFLLWRKNQFNPQVMSEVLRGKSARVQSMCQSKATSLPAEYEWRPHMHRIIKPQANLNGSADTST